MKRESDLFITGMITGRIGRHEVLLPINHKNYNFREKKNSQVMKERENLNLKIEKGGKSIKASARSHACRRNYNFERM